MMDWDSSVALISILISFGTFSIAMYFVKENISKSYKSMNQINGDIDTINRAAWTKQKEHGAPMWH
jgi:hypothetical protein